MLVLVLAGVGVGFGPLVRAKASAQAARRGLTVEIDAVRPGMGKIWLKGVRLSAAEVPAVEVRLDSVEVGITATGAVRFVAVHGGHVAVRGTLDEVERQVRAWRARQPEPAKGPAQDVTYSAEGVGVEWRGADAPDDEQRVWGLRYSRAAEREEIRADLARLEAKGFGAEVAGGALVLARVDGRRVVQKVTSDALLLRAELDEGALAEQSAAPPAKAKDSVEPKAKDALDPRGKAPKGAKRATRATVAGAPGAEDPAAGAPDGANDKKAGRDIAELIDAERGARIRRRIARGTDLIAAALPESAELDLGGLRAVLSRGRENLNVGPARLRVVHAKEAISISLLPAPDAEQSLRISLDLPLAADKAVTVNVDGGPVSLGALGIHEGDFGFLEVAKATLEAKATATLSADGGNLDLSGSGKLDNLALDKKWLAPGPVRGISLGARGHASISLDGTRVRILEGDLDVGKVRAELKGELEQGKDHKKIYLEGGIPLASCQSLFDAAPAGLLPLLTGTKLTGTFAFTGKVDVDTRVPDKMITRWSAVNECRVIATPPDVAPSRFARSWTREVLDATGRPMQTQSGPGTPGWVPRASISKHMETAVLICEDGGFFRHRGFDEEAIRNSIRENVKAGRFVRGASTISMQTAKNLYLSREKTLSRKLQEALLTHLLEQELSKDQILELYLNVIEFGPGIYGIGPAAAYYFNSSASQLSLGQSLYLASILPNPKRQYFGADGAVTPGWSAYLKKLMRIALKIHRVSESELEEALTEQVWFKRPNSPHVDSSEMDPAAEAAGPPLESEQSVE